tara:strand:+ start:28555 stop:33660 length:5106 start_codon:yes stop_codon:yes gene_type:complete
MAIKLTVGQTTFIKKIVVGTPVSTAIENLSLDAFTDFNVASKSDGQILVYDSSENAFKNFDLLTDNGLEKFYTPGGDKLLIQIDSSSTPVVTGISTQGNIVPTLDSTFDLGDSAKKFKDLYLSGGTIHLGGINLKDSGGTFGAKDSTGTPVNIDLQGSISQIRQMFTGAGDLSYDTGAGIFQFDVEDVYTKENFDSDFNLTLDSAVLEGVGLNYNNTTNTLNIDSSELSSFFRQDIRGYISGTDAGGDGSFSYNATTGVITYTGPSPAEVRAHLSATDAGGDGSFAYNSSTGVFTYTGPSSTEVRSHFLAIDSGGDGAFSYESATGKFIYRGPSATEVRAHMAAVDAGGDGSFSYDSSTGAYTYTGPSAAEVRAHFSGGDGIGYNSGTGDIRLDSSELTNLYRQTIRGYISGTDAGGDGSFAYNATTGTFTYTGPSASEVRAHFSGGSGIAINSGDIKIDSSELTDFFRQHIRGFINAVDAGGDGSFAYDSALGKLTYTGPSASEVRAHFSAGEGIDISSGEISGEDATTSNKGIASFDTEHFSVTSGAVSIKADGIDDTHIDFGTGTNQVNTDDVPEGTTNLYYTDARADSAAKASLLAGTGVTYDSSTGVIAIGQPVATTDNVTFNQVRGPAEFIIDPATVGDNTGTVKILGNLQVEGTQTIINSTTVSINDKNIVLADSAADAAAADGAGITINGASATLNYSASGDKFVFNKPFEGQYLGFDSDFDSALTTKTTSNLAEGTNLYYTTARVDSDAKASLLAIDAGGDGSFTYDSGTGVMTYTGPSASEVRAHFTGGTGIGISSGDIKIDSSELTNFYRPLIRGYVSATDAGGDGSFSYNSSNGVFTYTGPSASEVRAHFTGGSGIGLSSGDIKIDSSELYSLYKHDDFGDFVADEHVAHTGVSIIAGNGLTGGGNIASSRTINIDSANVRGMFSASGDLSYNSGTGQFSIDVEDVYTKENFDSDYVLAKDSANTAVERNQHIDSADFTVTVNSKTANHVYSGGSGNAYYIDGTESPILNLKIGRTYQFNLSSSDMSSHPFRFYYDAAKTTQYTTNVTTGSTFARILITESTPSVLHYQCSAHGYMGHALQIGTRNFTGFTTTNLSEGANLYYTDTRFDNRLATKTTDNLSEGSSNLYYTNARVQTFVDSAYVQARQLPSTDSAATQAMIDSNFNHDITFGGDVNFDSAGAIFYDRSAKRLKVASNLYSIKFVDNANIEFGTDNDTTIKHTGSRFELYNQTGDIIIRNNTNDADIVLQTDDGAGNISQYFRADGSTGEAIAYHYGTEKFKTSAYGATVTGTVNADSATLTNLTISGTTSSLRFTSTSVATVLRLNNNNIDGVNALTFNDPGNGEGLSWNGGNTAIFESPNVFANGAGNLQITHGGIRRFTVSDSGAEVVGHLITDSATIEAGILNVKNTGTQSQVRLYCEDSNAHYAAIQAPAHATFGGNVVLTLPSATGTLISTSNSNAPTTTTSASDADFVLVDDGGTMKKITPANLGISSGITIQDSGGSLSTLATTLNFVGAGVVASGSGSTKTITISGGGSGSGAVAGGDTMVQFNDGGAFGADAEFTFAKSTNTLTIGGPLIATSKSFDIKHPTKKGKRLRYGSLEGPENGVYIRGRANCSKINLPDYWTGLVDEETITVELTPIGKHQKLYVKDIADNVVTIGNDNVIKKEINCFYTIYGERKDIDKITVEY